MKVGVRLILPIGVIMLLVTGGAYLPPDSELVSEPNVLVVGEGGFDTVAEAAAAAVEGDIIELSAGTYDEPLVFGDAKQIRGPDEGVADITTTMIVNSNNRVVGPNLVFNGIVGANWDFSGVITRQTSGGSPSNSYITNLRVHNCTFKNCRQGVFLFGAKNSMVEDCVFQDGYRGVTIRGHYIGTTEVWTSYSNTIRNCKFTNHYRTAVWDGEGVAIHASNNNVVRDCEMDGNTYGVVIERGSGNVIRDCKITNCTLEPVYANRTTSSVKVKDNEFYDNGEAIVLNVTPAAVFEDNVVKNSAGGVSIISSNGFTFKGCTLADNGYGLKVSSGSSYTVSGNTFRDTGVGIEIASSTGHTVSGNTITGNDVGIKASLGSTYSLTGNTLRDNDLGLQVSGATSPTISTNTVQGSRWPSNVSSCRSVIYNRNVVRMDDNDVRFESCSGISASSNTINGSSVMLSYSNGGTFAANVFELSHVPSFVFEGDKTDHNHVIYSSNTVGGKAIYYYYDTTVDVDELDAGAIMLAYCSQPQVADSSVSNGDGVWIYQSHGFQVEVDVDNCLYGIHVQSTGNGELRGCSVDVGDRGWQGIMARDWVDGETHDSDVKGSASAPAWNLTDNSVHSCYNCTFDADLVNATLDSGGHLKVYNYLDVMVWDNGSVDRLPGVDVNVTEDGSPVYMTPHYGGMDAPTGPDGTIGTLTLMDREYDYSDTATERDHAVSVWIDIDRVWTEDRNDIDMSTYVSLIFEAWDIRAPAMPTGLLVQDLPPEDAISISWDANQDDTEVYSLYWNGTGQWTLLHNLSSQFTSYRIDSGLVNGTLYEFAVSAWDEVPLQSPWTTKTGVVHVDGLAPVAPSNLALVEVTGTTVSMAWDANSEDDVTGYNVYINESGGDGNGPWALLSNVLGASLLVEDLVSETTYYFVVTALDEVPNESPLSNVLEVTTLDITPPEPPVLDQLPRWTNVGTQMIAGTAEPGSSVEVFINGVSMNSGTADGNGDFAIEITLSDGLNTITARATDDSLNIGEHSLPALVTLDTVAPDAPDLDPLPSLTNETEHTLSGTAETHANVTIMLDGVELGDVPMGTEGTISYDLDLSEGEHVVTAFAVDLAGNVGPSAAVMTIVVDITPPEIPLVETPPAYHNSEELVLTGTAEPNTTVQVLVGDAVVVDARVDEDGNFTVTLTLSQRETSFLLRAVDDAGNVGGITEGYSVILDTEAPVADAGEDIEAVEERDLVFDGSGSSDNEGIASMVWSFTLEGSEENLTGETPTFNFPDPVTVIVTLTVTDLAGNVATDTVSVSIDPKNLPPQLREGLMDPEEGNTDTNFEFKVEYKDPDEDEGRVWVIIDGTKYEMTKDPDDTDGSDGWTYVYSTKLPSGQHEYYFEGKDSFGYDAEGPSAGDSNAKQTSDVSKMEKGSPGPGTVMVAAAVAIVALAMLSRRRRRGA